MCVCVPLGVCVCVCCLKHWQNPNLPARSFTWPDQELGGRQSGGGRGGGGGGEKAHLGLCFKGQCFECHLTISF